MSVFSNLRRKLFGRPLDPLDAKTRRHIALVAFFPQAHPGEESDERDVAPRFSVQGIERPAKQLSTEIREDAHEAAPASLRDAMVLSRRRANTPISLAACLSPFPSATSIPLRNAASASSSRRLLASAFPRSFHAA